jgi:PAS domain S-box-containing protein
MHRAIMMIRREGGEARVMDDNLLPADGEDAQARAPRPRRSGLATVGNWEWDFTSGAVTWSAGVYGLLGLAPESVKPSLALFVDRMHPEDRAEGEAVGFAAVATGTTIDDEFRIVRSDGEVRWLANKGEIFADREGRPSWAAGALFDITDIRAAQAELVARERRYRALATAHSLGLWRAGPDGEMVEADFLATFTGEPDASVLGFGWLDLVHDDDVEPLRGVIRDAVALGSTAEFSFRLRHGSGAYRWVFARAVPIRNPDGLVYEWVGSMEDVQERREAELALRVGEQRVRLASEACGMVAWDYEVGPGNVTRSEEGRRPFGFGSGPIEALESDVHPDDRTRLETALARTVEHGVPFDVEYRITDESGQVRWLHSRGKLVRGAQLAADRVVGVTFDVTAHRAAEERRRETSEELAAARRHLHALESVAGGIAWTALCDGKVVDLPAWRAFTGQTVEQVRGWGWQNAVHPADRERVRNAVVWLAGGAPKVALDYRIRASNGEYSWFRSQAVPAVREDGTVAEWVGVCHPSTGGDDAPRPASADNDDHAPNALTGAQLRAGRAIARWSVRALSDASGVSVSTIRRIEDEDGVPQGRDLTRLLALRETLERAGVSFGSLRGKGGVAPA